MKLAILALAGAWGLAAADDWQLTLSINAQTAYGRVEMSANPQLVETGACVQAQAAWLAVAPPAEQALAQYRKGYCMLAGAAVSGDRSAFAAASRELTKALDSPAPAPAKNAAPEPVSPGVLGLAAVARLEAGLDPQAEVWAQAEISSALRANGCRGRLMPTLACGAALDLGRQWLGWLALRRGDLEEAAREFSGTENAAWSDWILGKSAVRDGKYREGMYRYERALKAFEAERRLAARPLMERLRPQPEWPAAYLDLGAARILAGEPKEAIASLNEAVRQDPSSARALFLRARAEERSGLPEAALADYNLASRTAFGGGSSLASGEAHLYRGILLYRRGDYARAEDEFSSALNFGAAADVRSEAEAWRYMAAVAAGACGASRQLLEESLTSVSPYFPQPEAKALIASCPATADAGPRGEKPPK